jgi:hypothetical protein
MLSGLIAMVMDAFLFGAFRVSVPQFTEGKP